MGTKCDANFLYDAAMADELLEKEPALLTLPGKRLSVDLLDEGRKTWTTTFIPDLLEFTSFFCYDS